MAKTPSLVDLDHAATTRLRPEVWDAMQPFLRDRYGNPSGSHKIARDAVRAVDEARERVAFLVGSRPDEVIFTSGGTESNNHALTGGMPPRPGRPICSAVEHHAVLDPTVHLGGAVIPVDQLGRVQPVALRSTLEQVMLQDAADVDGSARSLADEHAGQQQIAVISTMLANNETGVINNIDALVTELREFCDTHGVAHVPFHTDAVQAAVWLDLRVHAATADLISLSGHKLGGPKGVGALIARRSTPIRPLLLGGGQEHGRRSGTTNVAGIVGFATALKTVVDTQQETCQRVGTLRNTFAQQIRARIPDAVLTVLSADDVSIGTDSVASAPINKDNPVLPNILHLCIRDADSETLLLLLESNGVCASAASSCSSGAQQQSHVLSAMQVDADRALGALRFSLGWDSTMEDVQHAVAALETAVDRVKLFK